MQTPAIPRRRRRWVLHGRRVPVTACLNGNSVQYYLWRHSKCAHSRARTQTGALCMSNDSRIMQRFFFIPLPCFARQQHRLHGHAVPSILLLLSPCIHTNDLILVEIEVHAFAPLSTPPSMRCRTRAGTRREWEICSEFHEIIPCDFKTSMYKYIHCSICCAQWCFRLTLHSVSLRRVVQVSKCSVLHLNFPTWNTHRNLDRIKHFIRPTMIAACFMDRAQCTTHKAHKQMEWNRGVAMQNGI